MDIQEVVKELRKELERIDGLILALDSLQSGRRRGRPPKLLQQLRASSLTGTPRTTAPKATTKSSKKAVKRPRKKTSA
jgi:hypothetical protein